MRYLFVFLIFITRKGLLCYRILTQFKLCPAEVIRATCF